MDDSADPDADLIDVTGIDLDQLDALPESVLVASLRRIFEESAGLSDHYSAFQNAIG